MAKRERGTISPEQIQAALRQGDSPIVLMAKGAFIPGNLVATDADGNAVDSGGTGGGGDDGGCCTTLVFVNEEPASCDWSMTVNDTWPPFAVNGVGV